METKFTKGEWIAKSLKNYTSVSYPHGFLTSANIIKVDETRLDGESWLSMRNRTEVARENAAIESSANMHLIAAAPDMYAMIESMSKLRDGEMHTVIDWILDNTDDLILILKKARGE